MLLMTFVTQAQQLLHAGEYTVYKTVLYRKKPSGSSEVVLDASTIPLRMIVNQSGVRLYKMSSDPRHPGLVGAPVYQLTGLSFSNYGHYPNRLHERYEGYYDGAILPPPDLVREPNTTGATWVRYFAKGQELRGKELHIVWLYNDELGKDPSAILKMGHYRLTFYIFDL